MSAAGREFMKLRMEEQDYRELPPEYREQMTIEVIDVDGFDYSEDDIWKGLKKESDKAFKKLKKREFEIRHK